MGGIIAGKNQIPTSTAASPGLPAVVSPNSGIFWNETESLYPPDGVGYLGFSEGGVRVAGLQNGDPSCFYIRDTLRIGNYAGTGPFPGDIGYLGSMYAGEITATSLTVATINPSDLTLTYDLHASHHFSVGDSPVSNAAAFINPNATMTGTYQAGLDVEVWFSAGATNTGYVSYFKGGTVAAAYTMTNAIGAHFDDWIKSAGSTITNQCAIRIADQTKGSVSNTGMELDISAGTGKYSINSKGTAESHFGGDVTFTGALSAGGSVGIAGQVLTSNGAGVAPTWQTGGGGGDGGVSKIDSTSLAFGSAATVAMFSTSATDVLLSIEVIIDTPFSGAPTMSVGIAADTAKYVATTDIALTSAARTVFQVHPGYTAQGVESLIITYSAGGAASGAARVLVNYATPT